MKPLALPFKLPLELEHHLRAAYANPPRAYHNFDHVAEVLDHMTSAPSWHDGDSAAFAILFHDAIYEAGRPDNEPRSAQLAAALIPKHFPTANLQRIQQLILLTARHGRLAPQDVDQEAAQFLDCDMAILAAPPARYSEYEQAIAQEYAALPRDLYHKGRASFLSTLLEKPRIYLSDHFHQQLDQRARENLRAALQALSEQGAD